VQQHYTLLSYARIGYMQGCRASHQKFLLHSKMFFNGKITKFSLSTTPNNHFFSQDMAVNVSADENLFVSRAKYYYF
jgi:hypothetical protein